MSEQPARYQRSVSGMVGAMIVLLAVIGSYVAFRSITRDDPASPVKAVDYTDAVLYARSVARFDVLAPEVLPEGWIVTNVAFVDGKPQTWSLSSLTEDRHYVGLQQAKRPAAEMVAQYVDTEAVAGKPIEIDGVTWATWSDSGGDHALVRHERGLTTLVVGTIATGELADYIRILR